MPVHLYIIADTCSKTTVANAWFDSGRQYQLEGNLKPLVDTMKVCLLKDTYVPNLATHAHLNDLGTNRVGTDQVLTGITTTGNIGCSR